MIPAGTVRMAPGGYRGTLAVSGARRVPADGAWLNQDVAMIETWALTHHYPAGSARRGARTATRHPSGTARRGECQGGKSGGPRGARR